MKLYRISFKLLSFIFLIIISIQKCHSARGGSRTGSGSSSRTSIGSRYTSGLSGSISRFSYSRSTGYRYGSYSGTRYGTSIRRTVYWPVRRVIYGSSYRSVRDNILITPPLNETNVPNNIMISDNYIKSKLSETSLTYDCKKNGITVVSSCYEPPDNSTDNLDSTEDMLDGGCCENTLTGEAVCCVIGITDDISKATITRHIFVSLFCVLITSIILIRRFCR